MYIERKAGNLTGEARIGRVQFSKSGKSVYFDILPPSERHPEEKGFLKLINRTVLPHGFLPVPAADRLSDSLRRPSLSARRLIDLCLYPPPEESWFYAHYNKNLQVIKKNLRKIRF